MNGVNVCGAWRVDSEYDDIGLTRLHGTNPRVAELTEERDREAQLQERRKQVAGSIQQLKKMKEALEGRIKCVGVVVVVVVWGWGGT